MDWDTLAILLDSMDIILDILTTMASVRLRLSQRLMLTLTFCMVDMDWDTLAILLDSMDIILDILITMASVKLSPRLTPTFFMEDMDILDMLDTMDTLIAPIATTVKLFPLVLWTANHPCFLYQ